MARDNESLKTTSVNAAQHISQRHATSLPPSGLSLIPARTQVSKSDSVTDGSSCPILTLANETLLKILDYLDDDLNNTIKFDRRAYLSQESFRPPAPPSATRAQDLASWRQACKRFSSVGAEHQFARVTTRFSIQDFERLDNIASQPHLASAVRKFSYMVPYFYVDGRDRLQEVLPSLTESQGRLDVRVYQSKLVEQRAILETERDQKTLYKALKAFTKLQHVQILPVQDFQDRELLSWIRNHRHLSHLLELNWLPACSHSTRTVGKALLDSGSPLTRFSSPHLNPQSAIQLAQPQPGIFASLVSRLACIELHFDDGTADLDARMRELSPMLKVVFEQSAPRLESVHVGFPSHRPVSVPLDDIFHGVQWEKLICFGIQGWKLEGEEIVTLVRRLGRTLVGLRLRDVFLKEESRWKDVLPHIRNSTKRLKWCSLRRIGYASRFDEIWSIGGAEIPDLPLGGTSDSSESSDADSDGSQFSDHDDETNTFAGSSANGTHTTSSHHFDSSVSQVPSSNVDYSHSNGYNSDQDSITDSTHSEHSDDEHGMAGNQMGFPSYLTPNGERQSTPDTPASALWCTCSDHPLIEDLEHAGPYSDNGVEVPNRTRKVWERWVIGRCPIHESL